MGWHGPLTYYQFLIWRAWHDMELNKPGRIEYYLMALRAEVRGGGADPNKMKLTLKREEAAKPVTEKEAVKAMHQASMARIGAANVRVKRERD